MKFSDSIGFELRLLSGYEGSELKETFKLLWLVSLAASDVLAVLRFKFEETSLRIDDLAEFFFSTATKVYVPSALTRNRLTDTVRFRFFFSVDT